MRARLRHNPDRKSLMPARAKRSTRPPKRAAAKPAAGRKPAGLGALPEWDLSDLYPAIDAPAVKRDLEQADTECAAFEQAYKGKLAALASAPAAGPALAAAIRRYEAIDDLLGRLASYAYLAYAGNTTDAAR